MSASLLHMQSISQYYSLKSLLPQDYCIFSKAGNWRTRSFISHNSIASLLPVVHFNPTLLVLTFSAHPDPGCAGWNLTDPRALTSSRLSVVKVLPYVTLTQPRRPPFHLKPPKRVLSLYPGMTSEFKIRNRVSLWITCIRYLLKHISPSLFLLPGFAGPPKDVLSCVLLLLSPGDQWHIRDSPQLILSFTLWESKLRACSPSTLYLLSLEIILNVMLHISWELGSPF